MNHSKATFKEDLKQVMYFSNKTKLTCKCDKGAPTTLLGHLSKSLPQVPKFS